MGKESKILKEVFEEIKPTKEELNLIKYKLEDISKKIKENLKKEKIEADIFVGGSYAKGTLVKKKQYDVDVFIRFNKKYKEEELSELTKKALGEMDYEVLKGSREYFKVDFGSFFFEIIPVKKVSNAKEAENITDLSYLHVLYVEKKIKIKLKEDILLAKAFCHGCNCYGAESYINGFSGYALELLILHYKSFLKMLKELSNAKEKIIIDTEKQFKNKKDVLLDLNESKIKNPIILIDPTYKFRNVLSALSDETFEKFKEAAKKFLKNPSKEAFVTKNVDFEKAKIRAGKKEYITIEISTDKQAGDIAGTKMIKFYKHLKEEAEKFFEFRTEFEYEEGQTAKVFLKPNSKPKAEFCFKPITAREYCNLHGLWKSKEE